MLADDGTALLTEWGTTVRLHRLPRTQARAMAALVAATTELADAPMPSSAATSGVGQFCDVAGALRPEHTRPRHHLSHQPALPGSSTTAGTADASSDTPTEADDLPREEAHGTSDASLAQPAPDAPTAPEGPPEPPRDSADERASSLLPAPDDAYLATAATTTEDLTALAPRVPTEVSQQVLAMDPDLDADLTAWRDPDSDRPKLRLLGPVTLTARGARRAEVSHSRTAACTEVVAFLACQEHGASPAQMVEAWGHVTAKTLQNRVSETRKLLGDRTDGEPWLPEAGLGPTGRARGTSVYELNEGTLVDADLFRRLRTRGQARGAEGIADLATALSLVTGRPFDQLRPGGYGWLAEVPYHHFLTSAVADVAHLVATRALNDGDLRLARWACETAIVAVPSADGPRLDLEAVLRAERPDETATAQDRIDELCNRSEDGVPEDLTTRSAAILQRRGWLAS
jgi:hypothetical protein